MNNIERWENIDLCDDCVYYVTYGRLPDVYTEEESRAHGINMLLNLGGVVHAFSSPDEDPSYSGWGCEGCNAKGCNVYSGTLLIDTEAVKGLI